MVRAHAARPDDGERDPFVRPLRVERRKGAGGRDRARALFDEVPTVRWVHARFSQKSTRASSAAHTPTRAEPALGIWPSDAVILLGG